eukprot:197172_1
MEQCHDMLDLNDFKQELEEQINKNRPLLHQLSAEIYAKSRENYRVEQNLVVIDKQTQLLVQDMTSVSVSELHHLQDLCGNAKSTNIQSCLSEVKQRLYEQLFYNLQKEPKYICSLSKHVKAKQISDFIEIIIFNVYGNQYNFEQQKTLLKLLLMLLKQSFIENEIRVNAPIPLAQILSAYSHRGQGLIALKRILERSIREMNTQDRMTLEINPIAVFQQIINSYEATMNRPWDGIRNPTYDEAADNKFVKRLIAPRVKQLDYIINHFVHQIIDTYDFIPFGIRWICRELVKLHPDAAMHVKPHIIMAGYCQCVAVSNIPQDIMVLCAKYMQNDLGDVGYLVGDFIFNMLLKSAIIKPERFGFVDKKVTKVMRRNFILVAKTLQCVFSGVAFCDEYMTKHMSVIVRKYKNNVQTYFEKLIDVRAVMNDNGFCGDFPIQLSMKQICFIHQLLLETNKEWNPNDVIYKILRELDTVP